jgi:hypothetical protein
MKHTSVVAAVVAVVAFIVWLIVDSWLPGIVVLLAAAIVVAGRVSTPGEVWRAFRPGYWLRRRPRRHDDE